MFFFSKIITNISNNIKEYIKIQLSNINKNLFQKLDALDISSRKK